MKLRMYFSAAVMAVFAIVSPATAQTVTDEAQAEVERSAGTMAARYAACLVAERPSIADIFLAASLGSPERTYAFNALVPVEDNDCTSFATAPDGQDLQIPETILTGYIAEARYFVRFPSGPPPLIASSAPATTSDEEIAERLAAAPNPALEFPRIFGDCVVRLRAPDVDRLVRTQPGTPEEAAVLGALQPSLGQCLWSGQTLEFSRETLRAALADALYRRGLVAVAPDPDAAAEPEPSR
ncbi:MAG: hypothetical protein ABR601_04075 [Parasphingopyxis sp.]|nr:hypothetical protein [Sphingomonadales bacterium]